ncbi:hypothetical protein K0M31_000447 [Melipona bicolor]|uniref:Uncharacterized protein n=1 Tax=Melipona bicolor TaxID=60889 RepID=A0AA40KWU8_9HYME|nr:hypothetical protein K0M31_000447 [Melipona bicolor]
MEILASAVIFKSGPAEQQLITGRVEARRSSFVQNEGTDERGTQARGTGGKTGVAQQQQGKEAQMCLFSGNNKKGRPGASVTQAAIVRKLGIMFRTRRSSGFAPRALALHPLSPTRTHNPLPAQPLPISSSLPLYACPPQIQTPN